MKISDSTGDSSSINDHPLYLSHFIFLTSFDSLYDMLFVKYLSVYCYIVERVAKF